MRLPPLLSLVIWRAASAGGSTVSTLPPLRLGFGVCWSLSFLPSIVLEPFLLDARFYCPTLSASRSGHPIRLCDMSFFTLRHLWTLFGFPLSDPLYSVLRHSFSAPQVCSSLFLLVSCSLLFVVRYGVLWYGVVWCDLLCCGLVWCGVVWCVGYGRVG